MCSGTFPVDSPVDVAAGVAVGIVICVAPGVGLIELWVALMFPGRGCLRVASVCVVWVVLM